MKNSAHMTLTAFLSQALTTFRQRSMPEMAHAREHHGDAGIVGGLDDFVVAD